MPLVTALYAGVLGLMAIAVAFSAGSLRGKLNIPIGDGGNRDLLRAMRRQANFVEWVPIVALMIALLEMSGWPRARSMRLARDSSWRARAALWIFTPTPCACPGAWSVLQPRR